MGVEAVFGLLEDGVGVEFEDFFGDFFLTVGGEAVEDDVAVGGVREEFLIDLVSPEKVFLFFLVFLAHRKPDISVDDMGSFGGFDRVGGEGDLGGVETLHEVGGREAGLGCGHH